MIEDIKTLFWFLHRGPKFYSTLISLILTKLKPAKDSEKHIKISTKWCKENCGSAEDCLRDIGVSSSHLLIKEAFSAEYKSKISNIINSSDSDFGGPGHINLIYSICEALSIKNAIETGVAYGWSSASILNSIHKRNGLLISIDMPMLKQTDYELIGVAVDSDLKDYWELKREPDRYALPRAIASIPGGVELVHYDSDKSYYGRKWSQEIIWNSLKKGGIFISDDVEDNTAFMEFVSSKNLKFNLVEFENKFVGIIKKF